jgi:hypothetical protein
VCLPGIRCLVQVFGKVSIPPPLIPGAQVEVTRTVADAVSVTGSNNAQLSSSLPTDSLPPVVDTIRTVWPINPYGSLNKGEVPLGSVMEFSMLDAGNHSIGDLNLPDMPVAGSSSMPVHFRVPLGAQGSKIPMPRRRNECLRQPLARSS